MRAAPAPGSAPFDVVGIGEISVDDVVRVGERPRWGGKERARSREQIGGGQVATAMVALARLGLRTAILGAVGDDEAGRIAVEGLRAEGVDTAGVEAVRGARTRTTVILVDDAGERTVIADEDPRLSMAGGEALARRAAEGRVLHADATFPEASLRAAQAARAAGRLVSCDLDRDDEASAPLLPLTDLCVLAGSWAGDGATSSSDDSDLPSPPRGFFPPAVAPGGLVCLTLGARGVVAWPPGEPHAVAQRAFTVDPVVDTTACGDTFRAGLLAALLDGKDLAGCLRFACAAAALKVRDIGRRGCPRRAEVEALLGEAA